MAPGKKNKGQKMDLQAFLLNDEFGSSTGNWADDVEDSLNVTSDAQLRSLHGNRATHHDSPLGRPGFTNRDDYRSDFRDRGDRFNREPRPMPNDPPFKAHVSGLPAEIPEDELANHIREAFAEYNLEEMSPITTKGESRFVFLTFASRNDLVAVAGDAPPQIQVAGKRVFVSVADRREPARRQEARDLDWTRRGPLPPSESNRSNFSDRGSRDFAGPPRDFGAARRAAPPTDMGGEGGDRFQERRPPREQAPARQLDWSHRPGPLSPKPSDERPESRSGSRSRTGGVPMDSRSNSYRGRRSPAAWPEGREGSSRPPRRDFSDRPERPERSERPERPERTQTAAERDNAWRTHMRPDPPASANRSRDGSEAPPSPAGPPPAVTTGRGGRPILTLAKRSVSGTDASSVTSPPASSDPKANPFGAARPIDTATREREVAEKRETMIKQRKEAELKAKEERLAKEKEEKAAKEKADADAAAAAEKQAENGDKPSEEEKPVGEEEALKDEGVAPVAADTPAVASPAKDSQEGNESQAPTPTGSNERRPPARPRGEFRERDPSYQRASRASDSANWRLPSGDHRGGRGGPGGPRGRGGRGRGGGGFNDRRSNGAAPPVVDQSKGAQPPAQQQTSAPSTPNPEDDGWTTVPNKSRRGRPNA